MLYEVITQAARTDLPATDLGSTKTAEKQAAAVTRHHRLLVRVVITAGLGGILQGIGADPLLGSYNFV